MRFTKMHGTGNDYIYINGFEETIDNPAELSRQISDRHFGVGSDGLIIIAPSDKANFRMRMWNSDGSEGKMCGNGIRCVAKYVYEKGLTDKTFLTIETGAGIKRLWLEASGGRVSSVQVDMGEPNFIPDEIPTTLSKRQLKHHRIRTEHGIHHITTLSMGNPHCVLFVKDCSKLDLEGIGSALGAHPIYPDRANVEFVELISRKTLKMRVYERGAGETLACGTGACACLVAAVLNDQSEREADIILRGGTLHIEWCEADNHVYMRGPAEFVCEGMWPFPTDTLRPETAPEAPVNADPRLSSENKETLHA